MVDKELLKLVTGRVINKITRYNVFKIPVGVSSRHVHVASEDLEALFGKGYQLTKKSDLRQPRQYICNGAVTIREPKGEFERVHTPGPVRKQSQMEALKTDSFRLGIRTPIRESEDLTGALGLETMGPEDAIWLPRGATVALHHIHMTPQQTEATNVWDKGIMEVEAFDEGHEVSGDVLIRVSERSELEMHVDVDKTNAYALKSNDYVTIRQ